MPIEVVHTSHVDPPEVTLYDFLISHGWWEPAGGGILVKTCDGPEDYLAGWIDKWQPPELGNLLVFVAVAGVIVEYRYDPSGALVGTESTWIERQ